MERGEDTRLVFEPAPEPRLKMSGTDHFQNRLVAGPGYLGSPPDKTSVYLPSRKEEI